jgi:hypothetical protein
VTSSAMPLGPRTHEELETDRTKRYCALLHAPAGLAGPARTLRFPGVGAAAGKQHGKEGGVARTKDTTPATYQTGPAAASMAQRLLGYLR